MRLAGFSCRASITTLSILAKAALCMAAAVRGGDVRDLPLRQGRRVHR